MIGWHKGETEGDLKFPAPGRRLRLGIVGGGRGAFIGPIHANGARLSNRWEIVAGALSSNPEVARQAGKDWFLPEDRTYADFRAMAASEAARADGIDAVAITTPNATHHPIARAFMERGIDVISDKPLTTTLADALDLVALQRQTGLVFGVTYSFAGHAMVRQHGRPQLGHHARGGSRAGRAMTWNGMAQYGALALGAPAAFWLYKAFGLVSVAACKRARSQRRASALRDEDLQFLLRYFESKNIAQ